MPSPPIEIVVRNKGISLELLKSIVVWYLLFFGIVPKYFILFYYPALYISSEENKKARIHLLKNLKLINVSQKQLSYSHRYLKLDHNLDCLELDRFFTE